MDQHGTTRRDFLKAGLVTAAATALGSGIVKPVGMWAATPNIKGPIKIGYLTVLSGTLAGYGEFHKMGALMGVEEINAAGGIAGKKRISATASTKGDGFMLVGKFTILETSS